MTVLVLMPAPPRARDVHRQMTTNLLLPGWLRVTAWCLANLDAGTGHAPAYSGQLRKELGMNTSTVGRAIAEAKTRALLANTSSSRCLVLLGHEMAPCPVEHGAPDE